MEKEKTIYYEGKFYSEDYCQFKNINGIWTYVPNEYILEQSTGMRLVLYSFLLVLFSLLFFYVPPVFPLGSVYFKRENIYSLGLENLKIEDQKAKKFSELLK